MEFSRLLCILLKNILDRLYQLPECESCAHLDVGLGLREGVHNAQLAASVISEFPNNTHTSPSTAFIASPAGNMQLRTFHGGVEDACHISVVWNFIKWIWRFTVGRPVFEEPSTTTLGYDIFSVFIICGFASHKSHWNHVGRTDRLQSSTCC